METRSLEQHSEKKQNKILKFILAHKLVFFLLLVLLIVFLWASIKMNNMERRFESEKNHLISVYDSIAVSNMELTAKVFAWAIRSEMVRENMEQVNQFFLNLIKEPSITKVQLIDIPSAKILISTDKNDEGAAVKDSSILEAESTYHLNNEGAGVTIVSPVMGLNSKIGILVIEKKKKE